MNLDALYRTLWKVLVALDLVQNLGSTSMPVACIVLCHVAS
jgi:hypothetical protein